jgi:hypothetical protein
MAKRKVFEVSAGDALSGLGENVVKIIDAIDGQNICFIGVQGDAEAVWFPKPANYEQIEAVYNLLHKKKFSKALNKGNLKKAQTVANKSYRKAMK